MLPRRPVDPDRNLVRYATQMSLVVVKEVCMRRKGIVLLMFAAMLAGGPPLVLRFDTLILITLLSPFGIL